MEDCPFCNSHKIGRIGRERYFCAECCHEWTGTVDVTIYEILADGTMVGLMSGDGGPGHEDEDCLEQKVV
ncbi:MAG: hypothetical protein LBT32_00200 [Peptococcaceae bacterium]|nr:hypothetical protein [Peptococcaceae bacterium]